MNISGARKILGKLADGMSDAEIEQDIETAILLKDLFFEITSSKAQLNQLCNNNLNVD